jgi:hypothetical protein
VVLASGQPEAQSCAAYDPDHNEIIYYYMGSIYRYDRSTGFLITTTAITGLPVPATSLNSTGVGYTGCAGHEYVVFDYVDLQALFIDRSTMAYVSACQLPVGAPPRSYLGMTYANGFIWLFNETGVPLAWHGYRIAGSTQGIDDPIASDFGLAPNPASEELIITLPRTIDDAILDVIDATGRVVLTQRLNGGSATATVDIRGLREGAYHARLNSGERCGRRTSSLRAEPRLRPASA